MIVFDDMIADIKDFKDFMKLYKYYAKEPYSFLINDTTLSSDNNIYEELIIKAVLVRKSKQSITKSAA